MSQSDQPEDTTPEAPDRNTEVLRNCEQELHPHYNWDSPVFPKNPLL